MKTKSKKSKGRRLQVKVAEALSDFLGLRIAATPPTKPGMRNGAIWVPEHDNPDIVVRQMSSPGADVAFVSKFALSIPRLAFGVDIMGIECKNSEKLSTWLHIPYDLIRIVKKAWESMLMVAVSGNRKDVFILIPMKLKVEDFGRRLTNSTVAFIKRDALYITAIDLDTFCMLLRSAWEKELRKCEQG